MEMREFLSHFEVVRQNGDHSFQARCPGPSHTHGDRNPSLTISEADGKILMHCHAGCEPEEILEAVGLTMQDLIIKPSAEEDFGNNPKWMQNLEKIYDYYDDDGEYAYSKLRYAGKKILYGYIEKNQCSYKVPGKERYLYNLKDLKEAIAEGKPVYIVEGEKDVDTMRGIGLVATTAGSAGDWKKKFAKYFKGAWVTVLPDNDAQGQKMADRVEKDIKDLCNCYRVITVSEEEKGDVTDYLQAGHSKEDLLALIDAEPWITGGKRDAKLKNLNEIEVKKVDWLVDGYLPLNQIVTIGGDGGSAKTTTWAAILAALSSGRPTPFEELNAQHEFIDEPKKVMFFSSEDPVAEVLKPKILKHGGIMENIYFMDLTDDRFQELQFGGELLESLIGQYSPAVVVFDPIQSFIAPDVQMGSRNQMRQCFNPLVGLCNKYSVTIFLIAHANKSNGTWGRKRLADSADLWDISRAVFLNGKLKNGLFYISQEKNNYAPLAKTLLFDLEGGKLNPKGFTDKHDKDFIQEDQYVTRQAPAKEEAKEFILETLQEQGGTMENGELMELAEAMSISANAMKNAKSELKKEKKITLKSEGKPGEDRKNYISLSAI